VGESERLGGQFGVVIDAAREGASWAFESIFRSLSPLVRGYLQVQGAAEPEDLTSDVFVAVLRNVHRFDGDEHGFRSWVLTIAHRRLLDERRRAGRRPQPEQLAAEPGVLSPHDVESTVESSLGAERVLGLCERLSPDQRDVVVLRLLAQLPIDEVAEVVGKTPGAVKALQHRGVRAIARMLEREGVLS
jgi:RNA polymerase sigma-70 factor (ECF subfamily)